jgi:hypothetical protein
MQSPRFVLPLSITLGLLTLPALASAEPMADDPKIAATGNANADTPALPVVPVNSPSGAFGDQGQLTVSSDSSLAISHKTVSGVSESTTEVTLLPAVDYFVAHNLSIGGFVGLDYTKTGSEHSTVFGIGPRVGYNIPLSNRISFWPKLGFSYTHTSVGGSIDVEGVSVGSPTVSGDHITLNIFAPIMFHPVTHFFVGFGPALDTDLSGDAKTTDIAARLTIGGWFGPWRSK